MIKVSISGIQEAQQANQKMIAALRPTGAFGRGIQYATLQAQRYAIANTHVGRYPRYGSFVGGGSLRASHRVGVNGLRGMVFIDPDAVNPITGNKPSEYGVYEHRRGFPHNFYERTVSERGDVIAEGAQNEILRGMP